MVSLARLWREAGVQPAGLVGHSQGEIAAAHIAGALSLEDAALIIAERGKAMAKIAGRGGMLSVSLTSEQLTPYVEPAGDRVSLAAINGPASLVLSGEPGALREVQAACEADDVRAQAIAVDYAAHSAQIEDLEGELLEAFAPISPRPTEIPLHSTVTGEPVEGSELGPEYWYRNLRQTVLLEPVLRSALEQGQRAFIEIGPHPVLAFGVQETIEDVLEDPSQAILLSTLRRDEEEAERFALSLAEAHASGIELDWEAFFKGTGAKRVPLPTYPFQRERYWIDSLLSPAGGPGAGGQLSRHPLVGGTVALAGGGGEGLLLSGRISMQTHSWLAQHAVAGKAFMPPAAFLELALQAAAESGAANVEELELQAPLILPEQGAVTLQVTLGDPGEDGSREISIHSRPEEEDARWTCHATGSLATRPSVEPEPLGAWPPEGAEQLEVEHLYDRLDEQGLECGPLFQGLTAAWRAGERIYAEVSLPEEAAHEAGRFAIHPALLESALRAVGLDGNGGDGIELPARWSGAIRYGVAAPALRLRLDPDGEAHGLAVFDQEGAPVLGIASLATRPLDLKDLRSAQQRRFLHRVRWQSVSASGAEAPPGEVAEISPSGGGAGGIPEAAQATAERALDLLQEWLGDESREDSRLTVLTHNAIAAAEGESPDLAAAAVWGLVRSAISEHPGRFALIDSDDSEASREGLQAALASGAGEPQLALREGELLAPRLARVEADAEAEKADPIDPERTILVTGGLSGLGALVARHLASVHGARHLLLVSRRGAAADGAEELRAELEELGAEVRLAACDVADRGALEELFASIPDAHPLGAIVHSAAVLDDGVLDSMDGERLARTMGPKATAAWHLHELSEGLDLTQFLMFSSAAGLIGGPAQANYAAANNFLDALAAMRRARGLPANSLAWGMWGQQSRIAGEEVGELLADEEVMEQVAGQIRRRLGFARMTPEQGLELFDIARELREPLLAPAPFDAGALRARAEAGTLAPVLRGLVRVPARRSAERETLEQQLLAAPEEKREAIVLDLVRTQVAMVLGHASGATVEPDRAFQELGFDSLAAVELRNHLNGVTGLNLRATAVFDYPSAAALADHLLAEVSADGDRAAESESKEAEIREALASIPLSRLRRSGLIDPLLRLALTGEETVPELDEPEESDLIDSMGVDDLIRKSVEGLSTEAEMEGGP